MTDWLIAATGPSLDDVDDWSALPTRRIAINHAARIVPDCSYLCAVDPVASPVLGDYVGMPRIVTKTQRDQMAGYHIDEDYVIVHYDTPIGSLDTAVAYAAQEGARRILFVGVDLDGGNAPSLRSHYRERIPGYAEWCKRVWCRCIDIMAGCGVIHQVGGALCRANG